MATSPRVRPEDVAAARKLLRGIVSSTPMLHSRVLSDRLAGPVFAKCENLQGPDRSRHAARMCGSAG